MSIRAIIIACFAASSSCFAEPPPGYYDTALGKAGQELFTALHEIIRDHHVIPYSSTSFDTSDALKVLDANLADTNLVVEIYSGSNALVSAFGLSTGWNREHQWPNSYGLDDVEPAYSDLFNLRAADANVNSARGNKYYDVSDTNALSYVFPAHIEALLCSADADSWQPPAYERGDIARVLFYMATRYTGDAPNEPSLILTDNAALIQSTNTLMGKLSTLLTWHTGDPVDVAEQLRNDRIYSLYQTNRNPFVDHPEWAILTFSPMHTNPLTLNVTTIFPGVVLSWPATNHSSHLEYATNVTALWSNVTNPPALTNGTFRVIWTNDLGAALFRLRVN